MLSVLLDDAAHHHSLASTVESTGIPEPAARMWCLQAIGSHGERARGVGCGVRTSGS